MNTPHEYNDVNLGHAVGYCIHCGGTPNEISVTGDINHCPKAEKAKATVTPEETEPFTHCDFCDEPIMHESSALGDGGHSFCDDDCMDQFNN